jgi:UDP-glucuronate 4-epimerase
LKVLVTGAAGFIGMHVCQRLAARGDEVTGLDNLNDYYDVSLKQARLAILRAQRGFDFVRADVADRAALAQAFESHKPERVIHLAAQVGVRNSLKDPAAYVDTNLVGFANILEACRTHEVQHLVYASSSSVYGGNTSLPFSERDSVDHPVSLYAATKKANELMAHAYSHLFRIPTTGLRFFTVYGPWGRPDMAPFLFARAIREGRPVDVFNQGDMSRDFTFIDDAAEAVLRVCDKPAQPDLAFDSAAPDAATSNAPYRVFNVGNSQPVQLLDFIGALESALGRTAQKNLLPMQPGDVRATAADTAALEAWTGFRPAMPLEEGVRRFAEWYLGHYPGGNKEAFQ